MSPALLRRHLLQDTQLLLLPLLWLPHHQLSPPHLPTSPPHLPTSPPHLPTSPPHLPTSPRLPSTSHLLLQLQLPLTLHLNLRANTPSPQLPQLHLHLLTPLAHSQLPTLLAQLPPLKPLLHRYTCTQSGQPHPQLHLPPDLRATPLPQQLPELHQLHPNTRPVCFHP